MTQIAAVTTWASLQTLTASALNGEFTNVYNTWNNHDSGTSSWTTINCSGTVTANGKLVGKGTATNDSAAIGYIGEYVSSYVSNVSASTNNQYGDLTSISLTAGDWDISLGVDFVINGSTTTAVGAGISTTSGNSASGLNGGDNFFQSAPPTSAYDSSVYVVNFRVQPTTTTVYYLKTFQLYSAGTPKQYGRISARRIR